jgi:thioredoxin-related protein
LYLHSVCPCSHSFFKQLTEDYRDRSFELVRIECWNGNIDGIKKYCSSNNGIKYKFLISDREIDKKYNVIAVPMFFILDGNKKIQNLRGYSKETTDK